MPVFDIFILSTLFILLSVLLLLFCRRRFSWRAFLLSLIGGAILTLLSLFIASEGYSGTGWRVQRGFPHFFYTTWQSMEGSESFRNFTLGPLGIYLVSNVVFYFSLAWLTVNTCLFTTRSKGRTEVAKT